MAEELENSEQVVTYTCASCHEEQHDDSTTTADGPVCDVCANNFTECCRCHQNIHSDEINTVEYGGYGNRAAEQWCDACIDADYLPTCDVCNCRIRIAYTSLANGNSLCYGCYCDGSYSRCNNCDELYDSDDLNRRGYCEGCGDDCCTNSEYIREYHEGHPNGTNFFGGAGKIHYGVELEVELDDSDHLDSAASATIDALGYDRCHLENDGSLAEDRSFEIITQPHTLDAHRELWKKFYNRTVKNSSFEVDNGTGMHVHIQRKYLTHLQVARMVVFINEPENEEFIHCIAEREGTNYCVKSKKSIGKAIWMAGDHYSALNTETNSRRTVELRIFKSTLTYDGMMKNLEFCDALVNFCIDRSIRQLSVAHFLTWLDKRRKQYAYLSAFITRNGYLKSLPKSKEQKEAMKAACA